MTLLDTFNVKQIFFDDISILIEKLLGYKLISIKDISYSKYDPDLQSITNNIDYLYYYVGGPEYEPIIVLDVEVNDPDYERQTLYKSFSFPASYFDYEPGYIVEHIENYINDWIIRYEKIKKNIDRVESADFAKEQRYQEYLKLKQEFESEEVKNDTN